MRTLKYEERIKVAKNRKLNYVKKIEDYRI